MTIDTAHQIATERFFTSQTGRVATDQDREIISSINERVVDLGAFIIRTVPGGPNQSLALTALEDVQMRAVRAIFSPIG